jgi:membrane-associated protein
VVKLPAFSYPIKKDAVMSEQIVEFITEHGPTVGYVVLALIIFAESGLFFGFFLPGDSLLLTVGLLASRDILNIWVLLPLLFLAAIAGDNVGYWFGAKTGPRIFNRENSLLFRRKNLLAAKAFYDKHGGKTITLARFMPFIRTFAPIVAGAVEMNYKRFMFFNLVGGLIWAVGVTLLGYWFGLWFGQIEGIESYFTIFVVVVIILSALPALIHVWNDQRHEILARVKALFGRRASSDTD